MSSIDCPSNERRVTAGATTPTNFRAQIVAIDDIRDDNSSLARSADGQPPLQLPLDNVPADQTDLMSDIDDNYMRIFEPTRIREVDGTVLIPVLTESGEIQPDCELSLHFIV